MYAYSPTSNTWEKRASLPKTQSRHIMATVGSNIYVFGKMDSYNNSPHLYSPDTDQWTTLSCSGVDLKEELYNFNAGCVSVHQDVLYMICKTCKKHSGQSCCLVSLNLHQQDLRAYCLTELPFSNFRMFCCR